MPHLALQQLIEWTLVSAQRGHQLSDELLRALRILLPDNLIIAALDTIDRGRVFKYSISSGRSFYQVLSSVDRYDVYVDLPSPTFTYCACPAFTFGVLLEDSQPTCKHVLAVQIARRVGKCVEMAISADDLVAIVCSDTGSIEMKEP